MKTVFDLSIYDKTRAAFPDLVEQAKNGSEEAARLLYRIDLNMEISYISGRRGDSLGEFRPITEAVK